MRAGVRRAVAKTAQKWAPGLVHRLRPHDPYPMYSFAVRESALTASRLGLRRITALELGVAGGNGLLHLQRLAEQVRTETGVVVDVVGFDLGEGMPNAIDYRDLPYIWEPGYYKMDVDTLLPHLTSARLILGHIGETAPVWLAGGPAPIGFISWDMDYYSSTKAGMQAICEADVGHFLPRSLFYFDDVLGANEAVACEYTGERLAIREFNESHQTRKISQVHGLSYFTTLTQPWPIQIYGFHIFDHPDYNKPVYRAQDRQLRLSSA